MSELTTRASKGSALIHAELDTNFKIGQQTKAGAYTVLVSDNRDTIEVSATATISLPDATTVATASDTGDFEVTIKNMAGTTTIGRITGTNTIDGTVADITLESKDSVTLKVNQAGNGYNTHGDYVGKTISTAHGDVLATAMLTTYTTAIAATMGSRQTSSNSDLESNNAVVALIKATVIGGTVGAWVEVHVSESGASVPFNTGKVFRMEPLAGSVVDGNFYYEVKLSSSSKFDVELDSNGATASCSIVVVGYRMAVG